MDKSGKETPNANPTGMTTDENKRILIRLTANGTSHFYSPIPTGFPAGPGGGPTHFHAMAGGHLQPQPPPPQQQQTNSQQTQQQQSMSHSPHSPSPPNNYHKDERSQRQHNKLLRKLEKQREFNSAMSTPAHSPSPRRNDLNGHHNHASSNNTHATSTSTVGATITTSTNLNSSNNNNNNMHNHHLNHNQYHNVQQQQQHHNHHNHARRIPQRNGGTTVNQHVSGGGGSVGGASSVGTSEDGEDTSSVAEEEEDYEASIVEQLSAIQKPEVNVLSSRSAKIVWEAPMITDPMLINIRDLRYNVLLSDRAKECKYKSLYKGESYDCIVQDLQPGQEYVVRLQVHYEKLQGSASEPTEFTTPPCEPDAPMPPKLIMRTKNSLQLRWTNPLANGSPIQHYLLEYDEGKTGGQPNGGRGGRQHTEIQFVEAVKAKAKHYTLTKLQPSTIYNIRMAAVNEVGPSRYSAICSYSTAGNPPTVPKPPTLQAVSVSTMRLVWERRQQDSEFILQMQDRESGHGYLNVYNGSDSMYDCGHLRRATAYQFRLRAENDAGSSPWSNEVTYKTAPERPGRPGKPHAKGKIHGSYFRVRWDPPIDTGGAEILRYFLEITSGSAKFERIYTGIEPETTCDRLQPGTTYQLRASCEGPAGLSPYSEVAHVTSEAIVPAAPPPPYYENPPGPYAAVMRLDKPDYNGGAPVLEFEVQLRRPATEEDCSGVAATERPDTIMTSVYRGKDSYCVIKDLKPGHSYEVQARAINRIGAGQWSSWFRFTTAAAPPYSPEALKVVIKSATHLLVSWQEPESNGAQVTEYRLESASIPNEPISSKDDGATGVDTQAVPPPPSSSASFQTCYQGPHTSADLRNLLPFTFYYFRVNASNVAGVSKWSPLVHAKTPAAVPAAPQIKDYEFTANEVSLTWTQPECNGSPITAYTIEYGTDRSVTTTDATTEYTIADLLPETSYKMRVQALNAVGLGPFSAYAKFTTLPSPPAPPALECTGVGHNFIKLKWGDGRNLDFTKFYVEMYVQRAKEFQVVYSGTNCMCKVNKLQERTAYTFRICAGNDRAGVGEYSEEYVFSTTATLPSSIKAPRVAFEGGVCLLSGHLASNAAGGTNCSGSGTTNGSANFIPSGMLPETPQRFIAGLGWLSVPLTLEWQHSKNSFNDRVEYLLQYAVGKDGDFKKIYRGTETKFTIENLEPGASYQFRVCPIRITSSGEDLPGQYTSAFRYQVPQIQAIDDIDGNVTGVFGATNLVTGSGGNMNAIAACHGHSHHSHHAHHAHNHSHHSHHHNGNRHSNATSGGTTSSSSLHHRSVSASAASSSGGGNSSGSSSGALIINGNNAIGLIPLGAPVASELAASFAGCDDPHHHHHHHHLHHPFHSSASGDGDASSASNATTASLLAATAGSLLANSPLFLGGNSNAGASSGAGGGSSNHYAHTGASRRIASRFAAVYTNRKRFSDQEKAVIFMVTFLFLTFLFATLVKMFMR